VRSRRSLSSQGESIAGTIRSWLERPSFGEAQRPRQMTRPRPFLSQKCTSRFAGWPEGKAGKQEKVESRRR
jgi:hypothetical protein